MDGASQRGRVVVPSSSDLTAFARIRNTALSAFAADGIEATSIRDVAKAAEVSAGLVQHYFPTKAALREAVNEYVASTVVAAFSDLTAGTSPAQLPEVVGQRITSIFRDQPVMLLYAARALAEHDESAAGLFDVFVEVAIDQFELAKRDGLLHADVDLLWAALQIVVYNLATILFEDALNRHLPEPLRSDAGLERWREASTALFERGIYKPPIQRAASRKRATSSPQKRR